MLKKKIEHIISIALFPLLFLRSGSFMRLSGVGPVLSGRRSDMKLADWNLSPYCC